MFRCRTGEICCCSLQNFSSLKNECIKKSLANTLIKWYCILAWKRVCTEDTCGALPASRYQFLRLILHYMHQPCSLMGLGPKHFTSQWWLTVGVFRCKCQTTEVQIWLNSAITAQSQDYTGNTLWMENALFSFSLLLFLLNKIHGESQFCCMLHAGDTKTHSELPYGLDSFFKMYCPICRLILLSINPESWYKSMYHCTFPLDRALKAK